MLKMWTCYYFVLCIVISEKKKKKFSVVVFVFFKKIYSEKAVGGFEWWRKGLD